MSKNEFGRSVNDEQIDQAEAEPENGELNEFDLRAISAESYERRRLIWTKFKRGDWWIAVGLYLVLSSVAFVVLK